VWEGMTRVITSTLGCGRNQRKHWQAGPHGIPSAGAKAQLGAMSLGGGEVTNTIQ